jgi:MFS family permease
MTRAKTSFGTYAGITFLIGFGFLTMGLMDPLYDTYIPIFLKRYISSHTLVGGIMTVDNILQLLLIPVVSLWSDRTRTKIGRRMPFIIVMLPLAAVLFIFIPVFARFSLTALVAILFFFNIFKTSVRGPVVALMPDTVPAAFRSEANGVINMMGGIGLIISTLALARLMDTDELLPFFIAGLCIIIAVTVLFVFVREKIPEDAAEEKAAPLKAIKQALSGGDSSVLRILIALFFWFMAYEGAKPFLGLYLIEALGVQEGEAALAQGVAGISSVIMAIPAGYLAHRFGRKRFICMNLVLLAAVLFLIPISGSIINLCALPKSVGLVVFLALMFLYGIVWMGVVVNSFPMLWQMASFETIGVYTGLYYTFSQGAAILAPPLTGALIDFFSYNGIFVFGGLSMVAALCSMRSVKAGEIEQAA